MLKHVRLSAPEPPIRPERQRAIRIVLSPKILRLIAEARGPGVDELVESIAGGRRNPKGVTVALSDEALGTLRRLGMRLVLGWHAGEGLLSEYLAARALLVNLDAAEAGRDQAARRDAAASAGGRAAGSPTGCRGR